jgi:hypothetical protein
MSYSFYWKQTYEPDQNRDQDEDEEDDDTPEDLDRFKDY